MSITIINLEALKEILTIGVPVKRAAMATGGCPASESVRFHGGVSVKAAAASTWIGLRTCQSSEERHAVIQSSPQQHASQDSCNSGHKELGTCQGGEEGYTVAQSSAQQHASQDSCISSYAPSIAAYSPQSPAVDVVRAHVALGRQ